MGLVIDLLVIVLGVSTVLLGIKGFAKSGIPLTYSKRLRGRLAAFVGSVCIVLGACWIIVGVWLSAGAPM